MFVLDLFWEILSFGNNQVCLKDKQ